MPVNDAVSAFHAEMTAWRRDIHAHPETAFEEHRTAAIVAEKLESFGVEVHRGLAGTGVVGTLRVGSDQGRAIALRADLDALPMEEKNTFAHRSRHPGKMHGCGHDGHTTMLLGAARYLAETRDFEGTVHFIFQPAEENEGGAEKMIKEGLFDQFPADSVYGMHNWPDLPISQFALRAGPILSAFDIFEITVEGRGAHGAMPHQGVDPVVVAAHVITALQSVTSRNIDPLDNAVISVTDMHGGDTWNVIPDQVRLRGCTRSFTPETQGHIEARMRGIVESTCAAFGATGRLEYKRCDPPTINSPDETAIAATAAAAVVGEANVRHDLPPSMGSEDFAWMLAVKPGCYVFIGNGPGEGSCILHNPHYDFNDDALPIGASYWACLVEQVLAADG